MENGEIRLLRADEIECRVSAINEKGLSLLLYKDARVDQKILDEMFTPFGWRRTHQSIGGSLYCTVEIWDSGKEQWVAKQDVGVASYSEKEKGQASDSFKRACFNWGIGRELYTAPFIWIPAAKTAIQKKEERYVTQDRFSLQSVSYSSQREIASLCIANNRGQTVFRWQKGTYEQAGEKPDNLMGSLTEAQRKVLEKELERTGISMEAVLERYHIQELGQMTPDIYKKALGSLKKTKPKEAA